MSSDDSPARIRRSQSRASDACEAVREFHAGVQQADMALVLFFCSSLYVLDDVAGEMRRLFAGVQVVGCTTAGEIGPAGYLDHSLTGASFPKGPFDFVSGPIEDLQAFDSAVCRPALQALVQELERPGLSTGQDHRFALLLIDGLSAREEPVARALQAVLGSVPLVGGSAGDDLRFAGTRVYFDGAFHGDSAILLLGSTRLPLRVFKTQHFVATDRRVVITRADAGRRLVREIDGRPAAQAFADLVGVSVDALDPACFAASPLVVLIDGSAYVRSVKAAHPDGSLSFFCAIEEGLVLRLAQGTDMVKNLEQCVAGIAADIGPPQLVIGFDCILRKLEMGQRRLVAPIEVVLRDNNAIGFSSYGEQYWGVHVNQTLTGIAFGDAAPKASGA